MQVFTIIEEVREASRRQRSAGKRIGFVPTMGALHDGHLSLIRRAKADCDVVFASIFVNPLQFAPTEDLAKYPRSMQRDQPLLQAEAVDFLFAPAVEQMYPSPNLTSVEVAGLQDKLCGKSRPGHFRGVTTVVSKLFHIVEPDAAFFGQKDAVQLALIRHMVKDQNFPLEIIAGPIVRESDGLAMSSRNVYLSPQERQAALALHRSLRRIEDLFAGGETSASALRSEGIKVLQSEPSVRMDYLEVVDPDTLDAIPQAAGQALVAVAAFLGTTRLIDNVLLRKQ